MSALPEHLARDLNIKTGTKSPRLSDKAVSGNFVMNPMTSRVHLMKWLFAFPLYNAVRFYQTVFRLPWLDTNTNLLGCFTYLIRLDEKLMFPGDGEVSAPNYFKIIREDSKPGRPSGVTLDSARHGRMDPSKNRHAPSRFTK